MNIDGFAWALFAQSTAFVIGLAGLIGADKTAQAALDRARKSQQAGSAVLVAVSEDTQLRFHTWLIRIISFIFVITGCRGLFSLALHPVTVAAAQHMDKGSTRIPGIFFTSCAVVVTVSYLRHRHATGQGESVSTQRERVLTAIQWILSFLFLSYGVFCLYRSWT